MRGPIQDLPEGKRRGESFSESRVGGRGSPCPCMCTGVVLDEGGMFE